MLSASFTDRLYRLNGTGLSTHIDTSTSSLPIIGSYMYNEQPNGWSPRYKALSELCQELLAVVAAHPPVHNVCFAIKLKVSPYSHWLDLRYHTAAIHSRLAGMIAERSSRLSQ